MVAYVSNDFPHAPEVDCDPARPPSPPKRRVIRKGYLPGAIPPVNDIPTILLHADLLLLLVIPTDSLEFDATAFDAVNFAVVHAFHHIAVRQAETSRVQYLP